MADAEPLALIAARMLGGAEPALKAHGLNTALAWTIADADIPRVRTIVHAGEFVLTPEFLSTLPNLGLIANVSAGYDGVDVPWCRANGIEVSHAAGVNADDVADHAMGLLIGGWRDILVGDRTIRDGRWRHEDRLAPLPSLTGRKVGIVGLGHIGKAVAVRAAAFKLDVSWWGPSAKPADWPRVETLLELATQSDILMVACRSSPETRDLISREIIEAVGPRGMIVNVSRGAVIDEDALIAALKDRRLGRAALDVFAQEPTPAERWADVPATVLTPHRAGGTTETIPLMIAQAAENVRRFLAGEPLLSPVSG